MFEAFEREIRGMIEPLSKELQDLRKRCTVLENRTIKEDRGDFLPAPLSGHNQFDLDEIKQLKQKLKEATDENSDLTDHVRHLQRRVFDYISDQGAKTNPSGDPNTGNI